MPDCCAGIIKHSIVAACVCICADNDLLLYPDHKVASNSGTPVSSGDRLLSNSPHITTGKFLCLLTKACPIYLYYIPDNIGCYPKDQWIR